MTEYTTSSQAIREYMSSRERTAYWVQKHTPEETDFYSPTMAPTEIDGLVPSSPSSDAESSHSVPPKMVLRYGDGRPDIPIPRQSSAYQDHHHSSKRHYSGRARTGSHDSSPLSSPTSRRHDHQERFVPPLPEEIRVLPSHGYEKPQPSSSTHHTRSRSLPRSANIPSQQEAPFVPPLPVQPTSAIPQPSAGPGVSFAQPQPQWDPRTGRMAHPKHLPPSIIYAPSHHSRHPHYAPPPMFHHPPQRGPNGLIYSHSAPVGQGQYPAVGTPYPSASAHSNYDNYARDGRTPSRGRSRNSKHRHDKSAGTRGLSRTPSTSSVDSGRSGSTYYVLPAHGQKVHIITPSPERSVGTATSTTKSVTSPHSAQFKRPFFQRLFSFAGKFSTASSMRGSATSSNGRRLQRRHSTGASNRPPIVGQPARLPS